MNNKFYTKIYGLTVQGEFHPEFNVEQGNRGTYTLP